MAAIIPKLAFRINTDPLDPTAGIQRTINCDQTDERNMRSQLSTDYGYLVTSQCEDRLVPVYNMREVLSSTSTRSLMRTGYGVRLQFNVEVEWLSFRNYFDPNTNPSYMAAGTWVADLDYIVDYMGGSTTGASDDEQRYFWLTPNYNTPDEQWIRVEPDSDSFQTGFGTKTWSRKMTCSFIASDLYKSVQRTTRSLGWTSVGEGLVDYAATTVTGTGTSFLRDFLPGYYIEIDGYELLINSVTSDTEMDADNPGIGPYTNEAYNIIQSGYNTIKNWYYPVYTFTTFTGQQLGWGYNWGNYWSGSS